MLERWHIDLKELSELKKIIVECTDFSGKSPLLFKWHSYVIDLIILMTFRMETCQQWKFTLLCQLSRAHARLWVGQLDVTLTPKMKFTEILQNFTSSTWALYLYSHALQIPKKHFRKVSIASSKRFCKYLNFRSLFLCDELASMHIPI